MFIGGLSWDTTDEGLRKYMEVYGPVEDCMIMKDNASGRSRGFGFLTFKNSESVDKVLETEHYVDGKKVWFIEIRRSLVNDDSSWTTRRPDWP